MREASSYALIADPTTLHWQHFCGSRCSSDSASRSKPRYPTLPVRLGELELDWIDEPA